MLKGKKFDAFALRIYRVLDITISLQTILIFFPHFYIVFQKVQPDSGLFSQFMDFLQRKFGGC